MESKDSFLKEDMNKTLSDSLVHDELANLKKITDIDNSISCEIDGLVYCNANEVHVKEVAELWANLASVQQMFAPDRYDFKSQDKNWRKFVISKLEKKHNLLLVRYKKGESEIRGFLYLQTITLPTSDLIIKGVIEDIYTKPQYRRQSISSNLLDVALGWTEKQNIKQVDLITLTKTKDLLQFYLSFIKKFKRNINLELITI